MKRFTKFAAVAITVIACSCSESDFMNNRDLNIANASFTFGNSNISELSRGEYSEISSSDFTPSNIQLGIYGYKNTTTSPFFEELFTNDPTEMYNADHWYVNKIVAIDPTSEYSFFAYAPYSNDPQTIISHNTGIIRLSMPICCKVSEGVDYIVATPITNYTPIVNTTENTTLVPLTFKHILSRVDFKIRLAHNDYHSIKFRKATFALPEKDEMNTYVCNLNEQLYYFQDGGVEYPSINRTDPSNIIDCTGNEITIGQNESYCIESYYITPKTYETDNTTINVRIEYDVVYTEGGDTETIVSDAQVTLQLASNNRYEVFFDVMYNALIFSVEEFNEWNDTSANVKI